mmetsp:Transcript_4825/g.7015  ORF Transcript_4825/g.7015 Transcript_4825/m.7015 type:complete len:232 (-) Transcript_4825:283-978(-)|eukprot:CAMPEP_0116028682 /NCGR_PEP_ID=MMETSP0321-20121206/15595_1 /TAXON_ID=163516 /ORGANISM="Leptocylindrus danicus var. danicus, Strain B650" /LENGTH=231 /DNA_ID=CAMNT_0003502725 /DNA_START=35 /DNA_END=730 /DNA_ORIENTATION=+
MNIARRSHNEEIVEKLNGALASLRRERDGNRRTRDLAIEKLRLKKEERDELEKAVRLAESNLKHLQAQSDRNSSHNGKGEKTITELEEEVEQLRREARFQHAELVGKRDKKNLIESKIQNEKRARDAALCLSKEAIRQRRDKTKKASMIVDCFDTANAQDADEQSSVTALIKQKIEEFSEEEIMSWPKMIENRAAAIMTEVENVLQLNKLTCQNIQGHRGYHGMKVSKVDA